MNKQNKSRTEQTGETQKRETNQKQSWEKPFLEAIGNLKEIVQAKGATVWDGSSVNRKVQ